MGLFDFFSKPKKETLDKGLERTKTSFLSKIARTIVGKSKVDDDVLDDLEEVLISSDVGVETTLKIIEKIPRPTSVKSELHLLTKGGRRIDSDAELQTLEDDW